MELDEPAAREALAEMETWGDDCSQDSKEMRDALRAKFNEENVKCGGTAREPHAGEGREA